MVEQDDALGDPKGIVIRDADDARPKLDVARPFAATAIKISGEAMISVPAE